MDKPVSLPTIECVHCGTVIIDLPHAKARHRKRCEKMPQPVEQPG